MFYDTKEEAIARADKRYLKSGKAYFVIYNGEHYIALSKDNYRQNGGGLALLYVRNK